MTITILGTEFYWLSDILKFIYALKFMNCWIINDKLLNSRSVSKQNLLLSSSLTKKLCCRKDDRAMRHIHGGPEFSGLPDYAHGYNSQHFSWSFVPIDPMNVPTKFEFRSFTRSWDNRGYPKNLDSPWIRPRSLVSKIFNGLLFGLAL